MAQLVKACTSVEANYCEADDAENKKSVTTQHQMKKYRKMNNVKYSIYNEQIKKIK